MFIGHYAPALIAARHPQAPALPTLFIGAQLVDIAAFMLMLAGVERARIVPGMTVMNDFDLYHLPYTHSLLGGAVFAFVMALIVRRLTRRTAAALITAAVVLSHWFVDLLVHRPDLTLYGVPPKLGLGLWNHPWIEIPLELGIFVGAFVYWQHGTARLGRPRLARAGWAMVGIMVVTQLANWFGPRPTTYTAAMPIAALSSFALFAWLAMRADRPAKGLVEPLPAR